MEGDLVCFPDKMHYNTALHSNFVVFVKSIELSLGCYLMKRVTARVGSKWTISSCPAVIDYTHNRLLAGYHGPSSAPIATTRAYTVHTNMRFMVSNNSSMYMIVQVNP